MRALLRQAVERLDRWLTTTRRVPVSGADSPEESELWVGKGDGFAWLGVAGVLVGFTTILTATLLSPTFSWSSNAISDLGGLQAANPWLFNGGLVVSGLLALPFTTVVWRRARHVLERAGAVSFALTMGSLVAIGVFPTGTAMHLPVSISFFVLGTLTVAIHGSGLVLAGSQRQGLGSIWLGFGHVLSWVLWYFGLRIGPGLAIPEFVGSVVVSVWLLWTTLTLAGGRAGTPQEMSEQSSIGERIE